jgi:hypothetical protein
LTKSEAEKWKLANLWHAQQCQTISFTNLFDNVITQTLSKSCDLHYYLHIKANKLSILRLILCKHTFSHRTIFVCGKRYIKQSPSKIRKQIGFSFSRNICGGSNRFPLSLSRIRISFRFISWKNKKISIIFLLTSFATRTITLKIFTFAL